MAPSGPNVGIDRLLMERIRSVRPQSSDTRQEVTYYRIINRYFTRILSLDQPSPKRRYTCVSDAIEHLWESSDKDPDYLRINEEFEKMLQRTVKGYRDHYIHSMNVFVLGYYILNRIRIIKPDTQFMCNHPDLCWMLAATCHDRGYAIQEFETWLNKILETFLGASPNLVSNISAILPVMYTDFLRMLSCWHKQPLTVPDISNMNSIDYPFLNEASNALTQEKNHGILSSLMLAYEMAISENFLAREGPYGSFLYTHLPACHAIAAHNLPSLQLSFAKHPIAFLLVLCDELQDWGRPTKGVRRRPLALCDVLVNGSDKPSIEIRIEATAKRERELVKALSRIKTAGRIELTIMNNKGEGILSL